MSWNEIFLSSSLPVEDIVNAAGRLFDVPVTHILVTYHDKWANQYDDDTHLICDLTPLPNGDFPLRLRLIIFLDKVPGASPFTPESVGILCELLGCLALAETDDDDNIYTWTLVQDRYNHRRVLVDAHRLDHDQAFVIIRYL